MKKKCGNLKIKRLEMRFRLKEFLQILKISARLKLRHSREIMRVIMREEERLSAGVDFSSRRPAAIKTNGTSALCRCDIIGNYFK